MMPVFNRSRFTFCLVTLLLMQVSATYAFQRRNIELLTPRSGQRGTRVSVIMQGLNIRDARQVLFYRPGIQAVAFENLPDLKQSVSLHHGGLVKERIRCTFEIAEDCPLGEHPLRLRTKDTLSSVATFWVGPFPIIPELERGGFEVTYSGGSTVVKENDLSIQQPNDSLATAQAIPMNHTVAGEIKVTHELDHDYYKIAAQKGERISIEIDSVRLCDKAYAESEYDLMVRLLDAEGNPLIAQDDSDLHVQDPILSIAAPYSGTYYVHIRQQLYKGGRWIFYRAHIGNFLRPLVAYPLGGQAGTQETISLLGDGLGQTTQQITWPTTPGDFAYYPGEPEQAPPSHLPLRVSPYANVLESEKAALHPTPVALNGIISAAGEEDVFSVSLSPNVRYRVRVFARGNGSPLDANLWIRHADADQPAFQLDDATWNDRGKPVIPRGLQRPELLDGSGVFTPDQEGTYHIGIHDLRGLGGARFVYRIEIEEARDIIHNHTVSWANDRFEINRTAGFIVPRGNRWTVNVYIAEAPGNSYQGPLRLVPQGLPPGVTMVAPDYHPGMKGVPCLFIASPEATPTATLFDIQLERLEGEGVIETSSQAYIPFINHSGGRSWHHAHLRKYALGVVESSPFTIEVESPTIPISQSSELRLQVRVRRQQGFTGPIQMQPDWFPVGISGGGLLEIPAGESEAEFVLSASRSATPGTYRMTMNGHTRDGDWESGVGVHRVASDFFELQVTSPFIAVQFPSGAIRRNQTADLTCTIQQLQPFEGTAKISLLGLPKGVRVVGGAPQITAESKTVTFQLEASQAALLGQYRELKCEITYQINGQSIRQISQNGTLRVDPAVKQETP
ncbi:MAG: hypothetical protein CL681_09930 [Blastopirellula sp.]|nr:hypothetical protein [Blastopirellula sp.]